MIAENFIDVPGGKIWSQLINSQNLAAPIIFLHGGPGSTHDLLQWALNPLANQFPLIFYDQLGSGNSKLPAEQLSNPNLWQIPRFVDELECLINFYNLTKFHLFGVSWGGALALEYLFRAKTPKASSVILASPLVSTKMWLNDANYLKQQLPDDIYNTMLQCEQNGKTNSRKYKMAGKFFNDRHCLRSSMLNKEQLGLVKQNYNKFNIHAYLSMWGPSEFHATGSLINYDRYTDLTKIKIPTLFTCGEFDEARPETVELFHKQVANSEFHIFKNCSHQAYFENPVEFNQILASFLTRLK